MKLIFDNHGIVIEGTTGVAVAGFLKASKNKDVAIGQKIVVLICGGKYQY